MKSAGASAFVTALMILGATTVIAQPQSSYRGTIRVVAVGPPGRSQDLIARTIAMGFPEFIQQSGIVDNKAGASGNIGATELARAKADGSTIGVMTNGTHGVNAALFGKELPYDPVGDFAPISSLIVLKFVLVVSPTLPVNNVQEFVAYAKANPDKVTFASAGPGSAMHMAGELFKTVADVKMTHIGYTGTAKALSMVVSGEVTAMFAPTAESMEHIQAGRVRALGGLSKQRSELLPDLKSVSEQGFPEYDFTAWAAVLAPKGTPDDVIARYNQAIRAIFAKPDVKDRMKNVGMEIKTGTSTELAAQIQAELAKWPPIVKAAGIKIQ